MKYEDWTKRLRALVATLPYAKSIEEKITALEHISTVAQQAANDGKTWLPKDGGK